MKLIKYMALCATTVSFFAGLAFADDSDTNSAPKTVKLGIALPQNSSYKNKFGSSWLYFGIDSSKPFGHESENGFGLKPIIYSDILRGDDHSNSLGLYSAGIGVKSTGSSHSYFGVGAGGYYLEESFKGVGSTNGFRLGGKLFAGVGFGNFVVELSEHYMGRYSSFSTSEEWIPSLAVGLRF
jgi:hypothetical protein